eukprot:2969605-Rhodomonas_salina.1
MREAEYIPGWSFLEASLGCLAVEHPTSGSDIQNGQRSDEMVPEIVMVLAARVMSAINPYGMSYVSSAGTSISSGTIMVWTSDAHDGSDVICTRNPSRVEPDGRQPPIHAALPVQTAEDLLGAWVEQHRAVGEVHRHLGVRCDPLSPRDLKHKRRSVLDPGSGRERRVRGVPEGSCRELGGAVRTELHVRLPGVPWYRQTRQFRGPHEARAEDRGLGIPGSGIETTCPSTSSCLVENEMPSSGDCDVELRHRRKVSRGVGRGDGAVVRDRANAVALELAVVR